MAKPIITLNGLKIVIMLGMLVIILCGIRFAAEIIVPFILALFIAVILNPLVQHMVRWRVPRVLAVSILMTIIVMAMVLLLAYLGSALNELTRTLPQYRNSIMTPLQALEPLLQRVGIDVSVDQLAHYIDPNAAMTLLTNLLTQLSNAMSSIFLLLLTVLFMLLEVPQLPGKFQQMMARPVEGMAAIQRAIDSVSHYLVLKTAISIITGLVVVIRIAEIFIDPLLGNIIDNTTTKWGRFRPWQFIASCDGHDFDRDEENPFTEKLLDETLAFLEENLKLSPAQCL